MKELLAEVARRGARTLTIGDLARVAQEMLGRSQAGGRERVYGPTAGR